MYDFPVHAAKLRKNERNTKGKLSFLFISECQVSSAKPKLRKVESKTKEFFLFFCRDGVSSPSLMAELRKNLLKRSDFGRLTLIVCMKLMVSVINYVKANVRIVIREFPPYFTQKLLKDEDF